MPARHVVAAGAAAALLRPRRPLWPCHLPQLRCIDGEVGLTKGGVPPAGQQRAQASLTVEPPAAGRRSHGPARPLAAMAAAAAAGAGNASSQGRGPALPDAKSTRFFQPGPRQKRVNAASRFFRRFVERCQKRKTFSSPRPGALRAGRAQHDLTATEPQARLTLRRWWRAWRRRKFARGFSRRRPRKVLRGRAKHNSRLAAVLPASAPISRA